MSLTKEMIMSIDNQVKIFGNTELLIFHHTHRELYKSHPNSFDGYRIDRSYKEIVERGLEDRVNEFSKSW